MGSKRLFGVVGTGTAKDMSYLMARNWAKEILVTPHSRKLMMR